MQLERFFMILLRRPDEAPTLPEHELTRLQAEHLAFYERLRAAGSVAFNGPLVGASDPELRGLACFRTPTLDAALELARQDPSVRAGRLAVDGSEFWTAPGTITAAGIPFTLP